MAVQREWTVGKIQARFEEPDVLLVKMGGPAGLEEAKRLTEIYRELGTQKPFFLAVDVTNSPANAEARSYFARQINLAWFHAILFVGASIVEKAIGKALMAAFSFTGRARTEILYPATIDEARALIEQLRAKQPAP